MVRRLHPSRWPRWARWAAVLLAVGAVGWGAKVSVDAWRLRDLGIIGVMRSLAASNESFRLGSIVDQDGDGNGEYGWLGELAGTEPCRVFGNTMSASPYTAQILGIKDAAGRAEWHGHYVRLALPTAGGGWTWEPRRLPPVPFPPRPSSQGDADAQEQRWVAYGWPVHGAAFGGHTVVTGWTGEVYRCDESVRAYWGDSGPGPDAAFDASGSLPSGPPPTGWLGRDGNRWQLVPRR